MVSLTSTTLVWSHQAWLRWRREWRGSSWNYMIATALIIKGHATKASDRDQNLNRSQMQHIWNSNVSVVLHEALQGLQIRYESLSNQNINLCIMTQGLQIRYALLPGQHYNTLPHLNYFLHGHCCITQFPKLLAVSPVVFVMPSFCMSLLECW